MAKPLREAARDIPTLLTEQAQSYHLPHFTADDAFTLGTSLRTRIRSLTPLPCVINITGANTSQLLFHAVTRPGVTPDHDLWVSRKRKTVQRWGVSSWLMGRKFEGDQEAFAKKFMLGDSKAGEYAIHGGGVPVFVDGVEGVVAVVVVSGMKQEEDHVVVVEGLEELKAGMIKEEKGEVGVSDGSEQAGSRDAKAMVDERKADGAVLAS